MGIKTSRYENEIWLKIIKSGMNIAFENIQVFRLSTSRTHWNIQCETISFTLASFRMTSGSRIVRELMEADIENSRIIVKAILRSVAVVDIPINDSDFLKVVFLLNISCPDSNVIEEAETHSLVVLGVVPWRTNGAKGISHRAIHDMIYGCQDATRRKKSDVIRLPTDQCITKIKCFTIGLARLLDIFNMLERMDVQDPVHVSFRRDQKKEFLPCVGFLQMFNNGSQSTFIFWMAVPSIVFEIIFMKEETCSNMFAHCSFLLSCHGKERIEKSYFKDSVAQYKDRLLS